MCTCYWPFWPCRLKLYDTENMANNGHVKPTMTLWSVSWITDKTLSLSHDFYTPGHYTSDDWLEPNMRNCWSWDRYCWARWSQTQQYPTIIPYVWRDGNHQRQRTSNMILVGRPLNLDFDQWPYIKFVGAVASQSHRCQSVANDDITYKFN